MKESLLFLISICSLWLLNACGAAALSLRPLLTFLSRLSVGPREERNEMRGVTAELLASETYNLGWPSLKLR